MLGTAWFVVQRILPFLVAMAFWTAAITIVGLCRGLPAHWEAIALEWNQRMIDAGAPTEWEQHYMGILAFLALVMTVVGWVILSYITVWVWRIIW